MAKFLRAVTVPQPRADLVACGAQTLIVSKWGLGDVDRVAIYAASQWTDEGKEEGLWNKTVLKAFGVQSRSTMPLGAIVAVASVDSCAYLTDPEEFARLEGIDGYDDSIVLHREWWAIRLAEVAQVYPPYRIALTKPVEKLTRADEQQIELRLGPEIRPWGFLTRTILEV